MAASDSEHKTLPSGYRGRFAPSPTGPLHFGSLVAAVGSYLQARSNGGSWQVRIEDIDPPRVVSGAAEDQLETLARFGMQPDGRVIHQIDSTDRHREAVDHLLATGRAFHCGCSRADLPESGVYPGTCRNGLPSGRKPRSVRFRVPDEPIHVHDAVHGEWSERLGEVCGDFVIRRADGLFAYQLAVVVDDRDAGITEVVRGSDLMESTARQQALFEALGVEAPRWLHLPLAVDANGRKLSKSDDADPVTARRPADALALALRALGHRPPDTRRTLDALWEWALARWTPGDIPTEPFEI